MTLGILSLTGISSGDRNPLVIEEIKYIHRHTQLGYEILKEGYSKFILEAIYYTIMRIMMEADIQKT